MAFLSQNQCALEVDRVYAMLSMRGLRDPQIYPDYTKSVKEVYTSTTEALMLVYTDVLAYAGISPRLDTLSDGQIRRSDTNDLSTLEHLCAELPSWVADWRAPAMHPSYLFAALDAFAAATAAQADIQLGRDDPRWLEIMHPGISSPEAILDIRGMKIRERLLEMKKFYDSQGDRIITNEDNALTIFARAIIADGLVNGSRSFIRRPWSKQDQVSFWLQFETTPYEPLDQVNRRFECDELSEPRRAVFEGMIYGLSELYAYRLALGEAVQNRTFFVTKKGYVGLAPAMVRSGDVVVLIAGMAGPVGIEMDAAVCFGHCYMLSRG
ncbi:MAG: hypothetical protein Q9210_005623 [Variospora velana]